MTDSAAQGSPIPSSPPRETREERKTRELRERRERRRRLGKNLLVVLAVLAVIGGVWWGWERYLSPAQAQSIVSPTPGMAVTVIQERPAPPPTIPTPTLRVEGQVREQSSAPSVQTQQTQLPGRRTQQRPGTQGQVHLPAPRCQDSNSIYCVRVLIFEATDATLQTELGRVNRGERQYVGRAVSRSFHQNVPRYVAEGRARYVSGRGITVSLWSVDGNRLVQRQHELFPSLVSDENGQIVFPLDARSRGLALVIDVGDGLTVGDGRRLVSWPNERRSAWGEMAIATSNSFR